MNKAAIVPFYCLYALRRRLAQSWNSERHGESAAQTVFLWAELMLIMDVIFVVIPRGDRFDDFFSRHPLTVASFLVIATMGFNYWYFENKARWKKYSHSFSKLSPRCRVTADVGALLLVIACIFSPLLAVPVFK